MALTILSVAYPFAPVGPDAVGGAEQVLTAIDEALVRAGHRSLVLACEGSRAAGALFAFSSPPGVLTDELRAEAHLRYRAALEQILSSHRVDVVHFHGLDFHAYTPRADVPRLCTLHLPIELHPPHALAPQPGTYLHCVSRSQRERCPSSVVLVDDIPNGVDLSRFHVAAKGEPHALVLSRICPEKGIHLAIAAAKRAGIRLHVHGRVFPYSEHQRYFDEEVAPLLDDERVFLGPIGMPQKARALSRAQCVLVPSLVAETSSLVAMEALASGTPVVAFAAGALPEIVEHGRTGFVVDGVEAMASAIHACGSLRSIECRAEAERRFSREIMTERYLATYRTLARRAQPPTTNVETQRGAEAVRVDEICSDEALVALRAEWDALFARCESATVFQSHGWLSCWSAHLRRGDLALVVLRRGARLIGVAPFFVWTDPFGARVLSLMGAGVSDYQDVLFEDGAERECLRALEEWLDASRSRWSRVEWSELRDGSPLLRASALAPREWCARRSEQDVCTGLALEGDPDRVLERCLPPGMLRRVRYARRRADREGGCAIVHADTRTFSRLFEALERLHSSRRHMRGERAALEDASVRAFHRRAAEALLSEGRLLLFGVEIGGELAAVLHGVHDRGATRYYQSGFDARLANRSPGVLAVAHAIETARARGATTFDFLRGREAYKDAWGAREIGRLHRSIIEPRSVHVGTADGTVSS
jgi:CelD/BcsL family acetyltransferase involved in cellulose biosynthesis/glycosyltransferase involved in cell wall biosynthesis